MTETHARTGELIEADERGPLAAEAASLEAHADFSMLWPEDVQEIIATAADTYGPMPPYAIPKVEGAMKVARAIERKNDRLCRENEAKKNSRWH